MERLDRELGLEQAYGVHIVFTPAAEAVENRSASVFESFCHFVEAVEGYDGGAEAAHVVAVVVLQVVDAP